MKLPGLAGIILSLTFTLPSNAANVKKKDVLHRKPTYVCYVFSPVDESKMTKIEVHYKYPSDSSLAKTTSFKNHEFSATIYIPDSPKTAESTFSLSVNNKELYRSAFTRVTDPDEFKVFQPEFTVSCATY